MCGEEADCRIYRIRMQNAWGRKPNPDAATKAVF